MIHVLIWALIVWFFHKKSTGYCKRYNSSLWGQNAFKKWKLLEIKSILTKTAWYFYLFIKTAKSLWGPILPSEHEVWTSKILQRTKRWRLVIHMEAAAAVIVLCLHCSFCLSAALHVICSGKVFDGFGSAPLWCCRLWGAFTPLSCGTSVNCLFGTLIFVGQLCHIHSPKQEVILVSSERLLWLVAKWKVFKTE